MGPGRRVALAAVAALAAAGACSSTPAHTASTGPQRSSAGPTSGAGPGSGTSASSGSSARPAGGPVPAGFTAVSYTAVSPEEFWLLGTAPCANPVCTSIVRTTDGGAHFVGLPAPVAPLVEERQTAGAIGELRFADPLDGYAFASGTGSGGAFWVTHDGGEHWRAEHLGGVVLAFTASGGHAYAVVSSCGDNGCTGTHLVRSSARTDTWTSSALPQAGTAAQASITVRASEVWVEAEPAGSAGQVLLHSTDGGATFAELPNPCSAGLGGSIHATSSRVVWMVCPTGTMAQAMRSTDGGATFATLQPGGIVNSSALAPADDTVAVLAGGGPALRRTTDGGASFSTAFTPPAATGWLFVGFTSPTVGVGISVDGAASGTIPVTAVWRTTDSGATWHRLSIRA